MSASVLFLVIFAAGLHAGWNLISKKVATGSAADFVFAYRILSSILYAPWVAWILYNDGMVWSVPVVFFIALTSLLHLGYSLCLQMGYRVADLSVVYPIARGTGPLLASLGAFLLLSEQASPLGILGIGGIVAGIVLIASDGHWQRFMNPSALRGIRWGLYVGLFIAGYTVADAYAVKTLLISPIVLDWLSSLSGALLLAPRAYLRRHTLRRQMRGKWGYTFLVALLAPMSYILVLFAYQMGGEVSLIAPLREMSMMIGTLAGFVLLHEKTTLGRLFGCAIILLGVVLLAV